MSDNSLKRAENEAASQAGPTANPLRSELSVRSHASLKDVTFEIESQPLRLPTSASSSPRRDDVAISEATQNPSHLLALTPPNNMAPVESSGRQGSSTEMPPAGSLDQEQGLGPLPRNHSEVPAVQTTINPSEKKSVEVEIEELRTSPKFKGCQEEDPDFKLLHWVAMLGHGTLMPALSDRHDGHDRHDRHDSFTRMAEHLVRIKKEEVFAKDKYGCTPLHLAAACGNCSMVKVLLEPFFQDPAEPRHADILPDDPIYKYINHQDNQINFSALHAAVSHNEYEMVVLLLRYGANPQVLDVIRKTAFQVAPTLADVQELLRQVVEHGDEVPRSVIVQLMAEVLERQVKEGKTPRNAQAKQHWQKASKLFINKNKPHTLAECSPAAVARISDNEAGNVIKKHFQTLYDTEKHDDLANYVTLAIKSNNELLTQLMIKLLCECPKVLASPEWHKTLGPLVCTYPKLFHYLLGKLKSTEGEHIRGFASCLEPGNINTWRASAFAASRRNGDNDDTSKEVKLLIYQQLVEGLKKVSTQVVKTFFEKSDQSLLNDMAHFPVFKDFVGLLEKRIITEDFDESSRRLKLVSEVLRPKSVAAAVIAGEPSQPAHTAPTGSAHRQELVNSEAGTLAGCFGGADGAQSSAKPKADPLDWKRRRTLNVEPVLTAAVTAGKALNVEAAVKAVTRWVSTNSKGGKFVFLSGVTPKLIRRLATHFPSSCATLLNVVSLTMLEDLATLYTSANVLHGSEHGDYIVKCSNVRNAFLWREQELARLVNIAGQQSSLANSRLEMGRVQGQVANFNAKHGYTEEMVDALVDYGVPFECTYKAALEAAVGATPEHFAKLIEHEFSGPELKLLISNGIRLANVIRYIEECDDPALPEGTPPEVAANLAAVPTSTLIRDMLQQQLNPSIVDIIMKEGTMFATTRFNNFRPGRPLHAEFPVELYKLGYTSHFVKRLLISWRQGIKNDKGGIRIQPWAKEFIDYVFETNDPLGTKLKSAYDIKLTDTQVVYIDGRAGHTQGSRVDQVGPTEKERDKVRSTELQTEVDSLRKLLTVYASNPIFIHRWPIYLALQLFLYLYAAVNSLVGTCWPTWWPWRTSNATRFANSTHPGIIDSVVLAFPILGVVQPEDSDILTELVIADAPSSWFHYAIVRALYTLHWRTFGHFMIILNAGSFLLTGGIFLIFYLLMLHYRPKSADVDDDLSWFKDAPAVQGVLVIAVVLNFTMLVEKVMELKLIWRQRSWVTTGLYVEMACHLLVWVVAITLWAGCRGSTVPALSGCTMLLMVGRLIFFVLLTEKLSKAGLALLEILWDARYFFVLMALVYGGFVLAAAGLRHDEEKSDVYASQLFSVLLGDFQSSQLIEERQLWRIATFSLILRSIYGLLILVVFMNLLIATIYDTYERVKVNHEVEVMWLRSHMMVFVKDFMKRSYPKGLGPLKGDVLHLLLRSEEMKSGRWIQNAVADPFTSLHTAAAKDVSGKEMESRLEQLTGIEQRLQAGLTAVTSKVSDIDRRLGQLVIKQRLQAGLTTVTSKVSDIDRRLGQLGAGIEQHLDQQLQVGLATVAREVRREIERSLAQLAIAKQDSDSYGGWSELVTATSSLDSQSQGSGP